MDDITVRRHVLAALGLAPMIDAAQIGVTVESGVVTLRGHVRNCAEKGIAERIVLRVRGVRAVVEQIEVHYPATSRSGDATPPDRRTQCEPAPWSVPGLSAVADQPTFA
ncbi:transporter [Methylobacterium sp. Leaf123]|nr:BON domain-containing protein [Methylobacterium sp. Leaf123]KQQ13258.1 transporter [Methylobacterium sp. Leaf123]